MNQCAVHIRGKSQSEYCFVKEMEEIENEGSENERQHPLDAVKAMKDTQIII